MSILSNAHTHSTWCDGANTPTEIAEAALRLSFTDLGFSSHAPAPDEPDGVGMVDEAGYRADIAAVKKKYQGRLGVLCGIEKDYFENANPEDYDYIIGSVHAVKLPDGTSCIVDMNHRVLRDAINTAYNGDSMGLVRAFYTLTAENAHRFHPDIVGHLDLLKKCNNGDLFDEESAAYQNAALEALDDVITCVKEYGGMIEMNMTPIIRGFRDVPYPAPFLLRHMAQRDVRVIVTSDSHEIGTLNGGFKLAPDILKSMGFSSMAVLQKGGFADIKL